MKYTTIVLSGLLALLISCSKTSSLNNQQQNAVTSSAELKVATKSRTDSVRIKLSLWYFEAIKNAQKKKKISTTSVAASMQNFGTDTVAYYSEKWKYDTTFIGFMYRAMDNSVAMYEHYEENLGQTFDQFSSSLKNSYYNSQFENVMYQYGQDPNVFYDYQASTFASTAYLYNQDSVFWSVSSDKQLQILDNVINYHFPPTSGGNGNLRLTLGEVGDCISDAIVGYLIGNATLVKDIYRAVSGSSFGWSFVYAMSGRILKQSITNASGIWGIAAGLAYCLIKNAIL